jgi:hypothetical protein
MRFSSDVAPQDGYPPTPPHPHPHHVGHDHFWDRALSRRRVLVAGAGGAVTAAAVLGVSQWHAGLAKAAAPVPAAPKPIPQTIPGTPFHVLFPGQGEPSVITDLNGAVGIAHIQGAGTGTDTQTGVSETLLFDADMRFMQGTYVGVDGNFYRSTFGFV